MLFIFYFYCSMKKQKAISFEAFILKFGKQGEKTGWRYIAIPAVVAQQLLPGNRIGKYTETKRKNMQNDKQSLQSYIFNFKLT